MSSPLAMAPDLTGFAQGDVLADLYACWVGDPDPHVIPVDDHGHLGLPLRVSKGGLDLFRQDRRQIVAAFAERTDAMLISQTCDIVQPSKEFVLLAPVRSIEDLPDQQQGHCRANRLPWAFHMPRDDQSPECFTDLRLISTIDKTLVMRSRKIRSLTPRLADKLTQALTAWFARPALPDDLVIALRPFLDRVKGWSRASQDRIHGLYVRQEGRLLEILAVMETPDWQVQGALLQAARNASERAPGIRMDLRFSDARSTTLADIRGFVRLDLGYLSYPA